MSGSIKSLYTDPHIFTEELEKIFYRGWVFIGHDSEIPQPGDFITRQVGTQSIILVRGTDHTVSALLNRCAHRGTTVCPAERGHVRTFTCPYHGWSYDLTGALQGVPYPAGYGESFDKKAHGLTRVPRLESYRGFVFVSLSPSGISLADHLGTAAQLIDRDVWSLAGRRDRTQRRLDQTSLPVQLENAARKRYGRLSSRLCPPLHIESGRLAVSTFCG